jgi:hypothetical protein
MKLKKKIVREQETYLVVLPATLRSKTKSYSSGHLSFFPRKNRTCKIPSVLNPSTGLYQWPSYASLWHPGYIRPTQELHQTPMMHWATVSCYINSSRH